MASAADAASTVADDVAVRGCGHVAAAVAGDVRVRVPFAVVPPAVAAEQH